MEIEQVKHAETPEEMRAEINRMAMHDALTRQVLDMANLRGMSGEDRYTMLAYAALKAKQEGMQRELIAAKNAPIKLMEFGAPNA